MTYQESEGIVSEMEPLEERSGNIFVISSIHDYAGSPKFLEKILKRYNIDLILKETDYSKLNFQSFLKEPLICFFIIFIWGIGKDFDNLQLLAEKHKIKISDMEKDYNSRIEEFHNPGNYLLYIFIMLLFFGLFYFYPVSGIFVLSLPVIFYLILSVDYKKVVFLNLKVLILFLILGFSGLFIYPTSFSLLFLSTMLASLLVASIISFYTFRLQIKDEKYQNIVSAIKDNSQRYENILVVCGKQNIAFLEKKFSVTEIKEKYRFFSGMLGKFMKH